MLTGNLRGVTGETGSFICSDKHLLYPELPAQCALAGPEQQVRKPIFVVPNNSAARFIYCYSVQDRCSGKRLGATPMEEVLEIWKPTCPSGKVMRRERRMEPGEP